MQAGNESSNFLPKSWQARRKPAAPNQSSKIWSVFGLSLWCRTHHHSPEKFFSIFNHQNCAESIRAYTKGTRSVHVEEKYSNWWFRLLKWGFWRELSGQPLCHILNTRFVECIRRKITFKHGEDCRKGGLKERFAAIFFCQVINRRHVNCAHEKEWLCYGLDCKMVVWKRYLWSQPVVS